LIVAATLGHEDSIRLLIDNGADVDARGFQKTTALIRATAAGHVDCVKELLKQGATVNSRDVVGNSALSLARESENAELVQAIEGSRKGLGALFR